MDKLLSRYVRRALGQDLAAIIAHVGRDAGGLDFPAFVADLLGGTFQAIVDGSIDQMRAYAELVHAVRESLDDFADDHARAHHARAGLAKRFPGLVDAEVEPLPTGRGEAARLIAMGVNRIIVTDGKINA
jgi:hypothetical protein